MLGQQPGRQVRNAVVDLCGQLKDDVVSLVDVIAPPDFILRSPIGRSDGQVGASIVNL